jgi:small neutral amino acid transporter SnatA (MarC family)
MVLLERFDGAEERVGVALAIAAALVVVWIVLRLSAQIGARVSDRVIHLFSRVTGLLLAGIAVELVFTGTRDWIATFA